MICYSNFPTWISPFVINGLPVRWYALMYLVAFGITYILFRYQCKKGEVRGMDSDMSVTLFCYTIGFLILGARVFSTLFYDGTSYYWTHPWMIFWPFRDGQFIGLPGMSYHGGVVGAVVGGALFAKKYKYSFFEVSDPIIAGIPLGYTFGRLGNFLNAELWGRVTGKSYGMVFPDAESFSTSLPWVQQAADNAGIPYTVGDFVNLPRHMSQLYEALFEGIILFAILWFVVRPRASKKGPGLISGCYFVLYGFFRFVLEYFREPDPQIGFVFAWGKETEPLALFRSVLNISLGQILCLLMIIAGVLMCVKSFKTLPVSKKGKRKVKK